MYYMTFDESVKYTFEFLKPSVIASLKIIVMIIWAIIELFSNDSSRETLNY